MYSLKEIRKIAYFATVLSSVASFSYQANAGFVGNLFKSSAQIEMEKKSLEQECQNILNLAAEKVPMLFQKMDTLANLGGGGSILETFMKQSVNQKLQVSLSQLIESGAGKDAIFHRDVQRVSPSEADITAFQNQGFYKDLYPSVHNNWYTETVSFGNFDCRLMVAVVDRIEIGLPIPDRGYGVNIVMNAVGKCQLSTDPSIVVKLDDRGFSESLFKKYTNDVTDHAGGEEDHAQCPVKYNQDLLTLSRKWKEKLF